MSIIDDLQQRSGPDRQPPFHDYSGTIEPWRDTHPDSYRLSFGLPPRTPIEQFTVRGVELRNPRDVPCTFTIGIACGQPPGWVDGSGKLLCRREDMRTRVTVPAHGTVEVPHAWLAGVFEIRDGRIVGGLAPWLEIVGETMPPLHPSLTTDPTKPAARRATR